MDERVAQHSQSVFLVVLAHSKSDGSYLRFWCHNPPRRYLRWCWGEWCSKRPDRDPSPCLNPNPTPMITKIVGKWRETKVKTDKNKPIRKTLKNPQERRGRVIPTNQTNKCHHTTTSKTNRQHTVERNNITNEINTSEGKKKAATTTTIITKKNSNNNKN